MKIFLALFYLFVVFTILFFFFNDDIKKDNLGIVNTNTSLPKCSVVSGTTTCYFSEEAILDLAREGITVEGYSYIYRDGKVMVSNK